MAPSRFAAIGLALQGIAGLLAGGRLLGNAGRMADETLAGFTGLVGLVLILPGIAALAAALGVFRGRRRSAATGRILGVTGAVVGLVAAAIGVVAANPGVVLLALLVAGVNVGIVLSLRSPLPTR